MKNSTIAIVILWTTAFTGVASGQSWQSSAFSTDAHRQFDFWIGEWNVNLRMRQDDLSWQDSVQSRAKIYSILEGRGILELWDSQPIKGYSLRYWDGELEKWVLWLNWPGSNRSGSSSLQGEFRHGRGEFFSTRTNAAGEETISRYSFSDITPTSLRWDDAFSSDGGKTWSANWIMEFTRSADKPTWPGGEIGHTYETGSRCDLPEFRAYEFLAGTWDARVEERGQHLNGVLHTFKVLDGCAVISILQAGDRERLFTHFTYNTYAGVYEATLLSDDRKLPARLLYGKREGDVFELSTRESATGPQERLVLTGSENQATAELYRKQDGDWVKVATTEFQKRH